MTLQAYRFTVTVNPVYDSNELQRNLFSQSISPSSRTMHIGVQLENYVQQNEAEIYKCETMA
jgi:hypothetical protein